MIRFLIVLLLFLTCALQFECGPSALSSDQGGTDFPNTRTVAGILLTPDGKPSGNSRVQILSSHYNPVTDSSRSVNLVDTTDSNGKYTFAVHDTGEFIISAMQLEDRTRAIISGIHILHDSINIAPKTMSKPGTIKVTVPEYASNSGGYVYIAGTTIAAFITTSSAFVTLDSVPSDTIPSVNYNDAGIHDEKVIRYNIPVSSGTTTEIQYPVWSYVKEIKFNTGLDGAAITNNVTDFPVLIRLSSANFTFSQADKNGKDIRFTKSNGARLFYEIEKWDSLNASAAIWVRVDTINGNNKNQSIMMYWGASIPENSESISVKVFDTAIGYQGVWHMSTSDGYNVVDATVNGYNGITRNGSLPLNTKGIIGNAGMLTGANFIEMPNTANSALNFPQHGNYSISAWVNIDSLSGEYQQIASKGDKQYNLQFRGSTKNWQFTEYQDTTGWDETVSSAVARTWVYLVGVRSGNKQYLYVNGVCTDSVIYNHPFMASDTSYAEKKGLRNTTCNFMIGKKVDYNDWFFKGVIDEVRVECKALDADRIKLNYMNQRSDDSFVVLQK